MSSIGNYDCVLSMCVSHRLPASASLPTDTPSQNKSRIWTSEEQDEEIIMIHFEHLVFIFSFTKLHTDTTINNNVILPVAGFYCYFSSKYLSLCFIMYI